MKDRNFAVWTMQRTGGTTFTTLLDAMHPRPAVHEPFNGRHARSEFAEDIALIENGQMGRHFPAYNIKHCYEYSDDTFNERLFGLLDRAGYFSVFLEREDHLARIESLALAELTGAYGVTRSADLYPRIESGELVLEEIDIPRMIRHLKRSLSNSRHVRAMLAEADYPVVSYEQIFSGSPDAIESRILKIKDTMIAAGVAMDNTTEEYRDLKDRYIRERHQNSRSISSFVPNIVSFRTAVREVLSEVESDTAG